jgi:hypothetical protein
VPSLDAVYPSSVSPGDPTILYGFAPDGGMPEGPVTCPVGFRMLDRSTLAEIHSVILAQQTSFGLFAPRSINLTLSAVRPFGSSASPPRHSRR